MGYFSLLDQNQKVLEIPIKLNLGKTSRSFETCLVFVVISTTDRAFLVLNEFQNVLPHKRLSQVFHHARVEAVLLL